MSEHNKLGTRNDISTKVFFIFLLVFQDPLDPTKTAFVISSLVPCGVAERGAALFPGDRLVSVNGVYLHNIGLEEAVEVLKSVPPGEVHLGICKPLVVSNIQFIFYNMHVPVQ